MQADTLLILDKSYEVKENIPIAVCGVTHASAFPT